MADFNITPDVAIVDPDLVAGLPVKQVAYTGMDALTHAIEAYVSTLNGPFTDPLALQAIEMVLDYLPASYNCNMDAREQMHYAQCLAGMAFSNALLGIVHSMHIRQAQLSPQVIFRMDVQMRFIFRMLSSTMQKIL